ncbi:MAG TPA: hypothetical protein VEJ18_17320, partial [Planctomycetota bacterium]|nr:hypothetical protein [Planctomycetota bacterium]
MKFRVRLFLAVLLPASLLVAACVAAALWAIRATSEDAVRDEFRRAQQAVAGVLADHRAQLESLQQSFSKSFFEEFVRKAGEADRETRVDELFFEMDAVNLKPDYFAALTPSGEPWHRIYGDHECGPDCRHPLERLPGRGEGDALFASEHRCVVGRRIGFEDKGVQGSLVVGRDVAGELRRLSENLMVAISLTRGAEPVFSSLKGFRPDAPVAGSLHVQGERYIGAEVPLEGLGRLVLLRPMGAVDRQRRAALGGGAAGLALAVGVAVAVSSRLSRRISRPVEAL